MKKVNKFLILLPMLLVGSSFVGANETVVADAASSATLASNWKNSIQKEQDCSTILITNDSSKLNEFKQGNYLYEHADVDTDPNNTIIEANVFMNFSTQKFDCVIYADVDTIYAQTGANLFASLSNVETITFDCSFSMMLSEDKSMNSMFANCYNLKTVEGLNNVNTLLVSDMSSMFESCFSLTSADLSSFDLSFIGDNSKLNKFFENATSLKEIHAPNNLNGRTIQLPSTFGMSEIAPAMQGMTVLAGSKELNELINTVKFLDTCLDYAKGPELQAAYDNLNDADKATFSTLEDDKGVLYVDKIAYMATLAEYHASAATAATYSDVSPISTKYPVIIVVCVSLALIGGYYIIQKKKYAK